MHEHSTRSLVSGAGPAGYAPQRHTAGRVGRGMRAVSATLALAVVLSAAVSATAQTVLPVPMRTDGPKSLDPAKGSTQYDNIACAQIYETLVQYKYVHRPDPIPGPFDVLEPLLLAKMPQVSPEGTRWTFTLRTDARFQDDPCFPGGKGRPITTDDVFYSWKRLADRKYQYENWWLVAGTIKGFDDFKETNESRETADYSMGVEGFRKIDDHSFEVELVEPVQRFAYTLAMFQMSIVPREAVEHYGDQFGSNPVGTGPFRLAKGGWQPGQHLHLERNPTFREELFPAMANPSPEDVAMGFGASAGRKLPLVDRLEFTFYVPDPAMWLDFTNGKIAFVQTPAEYFEQAFNRRTQRLRRDWAEKGFTAHPVPLLDFIFRGFNMEDPVVGGYSEKHRALRQAINLAIDLDAMNDSFYNGTNIVYDGPIPPGLDGHPDGHNAPVSYRGPDLERARELLAKAGYPGGSGLPEIVYYTSKGSNNAEQVQAEIRMLEKIGIRINPRLVDFSELIEAVNNKKAPMFGFAWGSDYPDAENNLALFYSKNKAPGSNHYNYDRKDFDELYERARVMPAGPERTELYAKMRDMVIEDAPYVGSQARTRYYLAQPWLKNFKPSETWHNWYKYLDVDPSRR